MMPVIFFRTRMNTDEHGFCVCMCGPRFLRVLEKGISGTRINTDAQIVFSGEICVHPCSEKIRIFIVA
ncbi:MAG: hypothetical protein GY749_32475 [Desulfobacteraceae bacterium]|nr:hypothetical protein [Desulfobacteraceae bacterium]